MKNKSDLEILNDVKKFAGLERKYGAMVIEHLEEVARRKLFVDLKYKSLLEYAIKELGFSESSANRRIAALKIVVEFPEVKAKLASGETSMGMLGDITTLARMNKLNGDKTKELIDQSMGKTQAEFRAEIKDQKMIVPPRFLKIVVSDELEKKFERVHGLLMSRGCKGREDVLEFLLDNALNELMPKESGKCREASPDRVLKVVTKKMRNEVMKRDGHCCRRCGSIFQLEVDHVNAKSKGGVNQLANLQSLCRPCNQRKGARFS